jgi:UDP-3-O-acyl-N-acetylglucosamine deacetylase
MKITGIFLIFVLTALLPTVMFFSFSNVNAQNSTVNLQFQKSNLTGGEKSYILIFGQRTIGNIDNSTKIVSSIIGHSIVKINEEFLEEISLAPTQQLENQVNKIMQDGLSGSSCGNSLITQEGQKVSVDCISSKNAIIWYIHP